MNILLLRYWDCGLGFAIFQMFV